MLKITSRVNLDAAVKAPNVCEMLSAEDLKEIGRFCLGDFQADLQSRVEWEERYKKSMELAMQVMKNKTYPWPNASNVKFPLLTIAALNGHAQAYPALVRNPDLVQQQVIGDDPDGGKQQRAVKVGKYMSYQLLEASNWEDSTDQGLLVLWILGTIFKKSVQERGKLCSDLVLPQDLVVNYWAEQDRDFRASHRFNLWPNEVHTKIGYGDYRKVDDAEYQSLKALAISDASPKADNAGTSITRSAVSDGPVQEVRDKTQGMQQPFGNAGPSHFIEQQTWLDLDGDGYAEPYFVTFHEESGYVMRIVARWLPKGVMRGSNGEVIEIKAEQCYTTYRLIPAADGGFYGMGLGQLLGPINHTIDTLINQLIDAGTMATLGGGFLGRGARFKYGQNMFRPFEWANVDSTGDDLRKSVFPLPVREPSSVLFNLLTYLVGYGEKVGSAGDMQTGEVGDNVKAEVARIANENGRKIFNAIYKRIRRAMGREFQLLYRLNQLSVGTPLGDEQLEKLFKVTTEDFSVDPLAICPCADPNIVSDEKRKEQALFVYQTAQQQPGHDLDLVTRRLYAAFDVHGVDSFFPPKNSERAQQLQPGPSIQMLEVQVKQRTAEARYFDAETKRMQAMGELQLKAQKIGSEILDLQAQAVKALKEADGVDMDNVTNLINAQIQAKKHHQDGILNSLKLMKEIMDVKREGSSGTGIGSPADAGDSEGA